MNAVKHIHRRSTREALDRIQHWVKRIEADMDANPDGVVPWLPIQAVCEGTQALIYHAGHVNGAHFASGGREL